MHVMYVCVCVCLCVVCVFVCFYIRVLACECISLCLAACVCVCVSWSMRLYRSLNDDSPLGLRRILSQSTDSLNFKNRAMSMESLNDEGETELCSTQTRCPNRKTSLPVNPPSPLFRTAVCICDFTNVSSLADPNVWIDKRSM